MTVVYPINSPLCCNKLLLMQQFKTIHIHYSPVSKGQQSGFGLAEFSAQDLTRLQSICGAWLWSHLRLDWGRTEGFSHRLPSATCHLCFPTKQFISLKPVRSERLQQKALKSYIIESCILCHFCCFPLVPRKPQVLNIPQVRESHKGMRQDGGTTQRIFSPLLL